MEPVIAYYQPYSMSPWLSVPVHRLLQRRVGRQVTSWKGLEAHALGAWMPELEFTHYLPTRLWRQLVASCDFHVAVTGNCLAASQYALGGQPFWAWVATPWAEDRADRVRSFPWYRRWLDAAVSSHGARRLERKVVASGTIVALSQYTQESLNNCVGGDSVRFVMPMGIDTAHFRPRARQDTAAKVGFIGRYDDPRKNIGLLIDAVAWCRRRGHPITAILAGADERNVIENMLRERGLQDEVELHGDVDRESLPDLLSGLSAFVVPSHQEGLCIAALEAMACGLPVISTRCGGPEEYIRDGETGFLVDAAAPALGQRILDIVLDTSLRQSLGAGARRLIEDSYAEQRTEGIFWSSFNEAFPMGRAA